ncbi:uncharacterized protein PFLUO_LOCUS234 [Penicillium psychrofluorescens]|uniref:uncharacterized protein n=1 Tax=Penicillium psychrofluorescens TaxID=3158075 RepID=UPI003CCD2B00
MPPKPRSVPDLEVNVRLDQLQCQDLSIFEWDETSPWSEHSVEDDVNALSLSQKRRSSFVGISSVAAALRALENVVPGQFAEEKFMPSKMSTTSPFESQMVIIPQPSVNRVSSYHEEQRLIDAYFANIHVFAPIIHEPRFRNKYLTDQGSQDRSWLALLNMVLALGSVATSRGDSEEDLQYYQLAQQYLSLESFGSGRLETLQALVLMGGMYLHYRSRPNMASAIIGACYRIASGLGLHLHASEDAERRAILGEEVKRRNWWTIYVLDTWGSVTLGRPSAMLGTLLDQPKNILDDQFGELPPTEPTIHSPLIHNVQLCKIINQIQDRFLITSVLSDEELHVYDNMLISWFEGLPLFLRVSDPSAPGLHDARLVLKWRYQNIRLLLHRPLLLDTVIRKIQFEFLSPIEQSIVSKCRHIAAESIFSIQAEWRATKMCCWNGIWFLFQACLIPLMALAIEPTGSSDYQRWCNQVQISIAICDDMAQLSPVGHKTKAFLEQLFLAIVKTSPHSQHYQPNTDGQMPLNTVMEFLTGDWDHVNGYDAFSQYNTPDMSSLEDQFFLQPYN